MAKLAGECGIVLPRQAGRRRALLGAFVAAFRAASLERGRRYRALRRRAHHVPGLWCELADGGEIGAGAGVVEPAAGLTRRRTKPGRKLGEGRHRDER